MRGDSERPHPRDLSPPTPVSASRRKAAFTGSPQRTRLSSSANETRHHNPQPSPSPRQAQQWSSTFPLATRAKTALAPIPPRNVPEGIPRFSIPNRHSLLGSTSQLSS